MKIRFKPIFLSIALAMSVSSRVKAQDMVTAVGHEGLEKTVSYDVSKFTDIRDKKLEDVLRKMPGISEMTFDGSTSYSYNGMFIEKIYVNGMDILEGNDEPVYNMKPEDVEKLEITENHVNMKVMRGMQYSSSASINVVLKEGDSDWSGSVKGGLGLTPLLLNADVNAINLGSKMQTTLLFKADNTGLGFGGVLSGFGGEMDDWSMSASTAGSGIDFSVRNFLNVAPTLAPLAPERVRFNRSGLANIGTTFKLNDDYQLNFQLIYHTDRLTASSMDETTYYINNGEKIADARGENSKSHQHDVQAELTLLSNTESQYLRNQLHFALRRYDVDQINSGSFPNDQHTHSTPLLVKNDFLYKRLLGKNILTLSLNAGLYSRPQDLRVRREKGDFAQLIQANSAYADGGVSFDARLNKSLTLSLNGGVTGNIRQLDMQLTGLGDYTPDIDSRFSIFNAYAGASFTYITDKLQATLKLPLKFGHYDLSDKMTALNLKDSKFYLAPSLSMKYEATEELSLSLDASVSGNERKRMGIYPSLIFNDFRSATQGHPSFNGYREASVMLNASYSHPHTSVFINGSLSYWGETLHLNPVMDFKDEFIINGFTDSDSHTDWWEANFDISKGFESLKGKIGISARGNIMNAAMERNGVDLPYTSQSFTISPYINGRVNSWWNVVYKLEYNHTNLSMNEEDTSASSTSYTQNLEMIFSPWQKFNFSVMGEHYYTKFSENQSKNLVLFDFKAEYTLSDSWQLILSAKNILNQKTYNYTLADSDLFTKSYTSYEIRPRNLLLSLYYKF